MFWLSQKARRPIMIGSNARLLLPWSLMNLAASERFFPIHPEGQSI
jgi:hypothetical protein